MASENRCALCCCLAYPASDSSKNLATCSFDIGPAFFCKQLTSGNFWGIKTQKKQKIRVGLLQGEGREQRQMAPFKARSLRCAAEVAPPPAGNPGKVGSALPRSLQLQEHGRYFYKTVTLAYGDVTHEGPVVKEMRKVLPNRRSLSRTNLHRRNALKTRSEEIGN